MEKSVLSKDEIRNKYQLLVSGLKYSTHQRGFEFERLIFSLLQNAKVEPRASYKPSGEQVDGSFFWHGQTFLLEAKWTKDPLPASSIYAFKGKLDGKFHTNSGIFISVNGFSKDVEDALKFGKSLNILLFDENDVPLLFNGEVEFLEMLKFKLREAGDTGSLKAPYKLKEKANEILKTNREFLNLDEFIEKIEIDSIPQRKQLVDELLVFVEGWTDIPLVNKLIKPLKDKYFLSYQTISLDGVNNIRQLPSLLNVYGGYEKNKAVIIILDDDLLTNYMNGIIENIIEQLKKSSIPIRPIVLYLNEELKEKLKNTKLTLSDLHNEPTFEKLDLFIQEIAEEYYDPITVTPKEVLKNRLESLEWDFEENEIQADDDYYGHPIILKSLNDLISYLNDEIIEAMYGEMPSEWLKEQDSLDYEDDVRNYLLNNYSTKISKIGWDVDDL